MAKQGRLIIMCENIFTVKEAMAILKVPETTVLMLLKTQAMEHFKVRNKIRISETHISNYLESVKVPLKNSNGGELKDAV